MAPTARKDTATGLLRVVSAAVVWGTIPLVLSGVSHVAAPVQVFFRVLFAGIVILTWMAFSGGLAEVRALPRAKFLQLAGQGAILTVNWVLFFAAYGLAKSNVGTVVLLGYTGPVLVAALAPFVTGDLFDRRIVLPLLLALGGIVVIVLPQGLAFGGDWRELLGAAFAFASALTYAILLLRSKKIMLDVSSTALMLVEYVVATILLLPFVVWFYLDGQGPVALVDYGLLATLGVIHTAFAGILFLSGLRKVRTDHAAILTYAEPVSVVLFAAAFLGQPLTAPTIAGGAMVVAGGALVTRLGAREVGYGLEAPAGTTDDDPADRDADAA